MTRNCRICGYRLDDYGPDEIVCGACLDNYTEEAAELGDPTAIEMMLASAEDTWFDEGGNQIGN